MEMWLKQSTLVLLTAAVAAMVTSAQIPVTLDETLRKMDVHFGSSLALTCHLSTEKYERFRVSWYFNHSGFCFTDSCLLFTKVHNKSANNSNKTTNQDLKDDGQDTEKTYILSNFTQENNGWYSCAVTVEIPVYNVIKSNGTQVITKSLMEITTYPSIVTNKQVTPPEHGQVINWWMWILLGVSTFILIILLVICILLRRRLRRSREPDPIYINTRPMVNKQPSPRPGENLKTDPFSQNLRAPSPGRRYEESKRRQRQ